MAAALGAVGALATLLTGCAGRRVEGGVFHSSKGYRVALPGPEWTVVDSSRADLELRHQTEVAGMLINAACADAEARRPPSRLAAHLLAGLRGRTVLERADAVVAGRPAARAVLEARAGADGAPLRIETYTLTDGGCVYDLIYAAESPVFEAGHAAFERFVGSFSRE
jgi:hypothetical protein